MTANNAKELIFKIEKSRNPYIKPGKIINPSNSYDDYYFRTRVLGQWGQGMNAIFNNTNEVEEKTMKEKVLELLNENEVEIVDNKVKAYIRVIDDEVEEFNEGGRVRGEKRSFYLKVEDAFRTQNCVYIQNDKSIVEQLKEIPDVYEVEIDIDDVKVIDYDFYLRDLMVPTNDIVSSNFKIISKVNLESKIQFDIRDITKDDDGFDVVEVGIFNSLTENYHCYTSYELDKEDITDMVMKYLTDNQERVNTLKELSKEPVTLDI